MTRLPCLPSLLRLTSACRGQVIDDDTEWLAPGEVAITIIATGFTGQEAAFTGGPLEVLSDP